MPLIEKVAVSCHKKLTQGELYVTVSFGKYVCQKILCLGVQRAQDTTGDVD